MNVRIVEYAPGYRALEWTRKVQILLCLSGVLRTELADGSLVLIGPGTSYRVPEKDPAHRCHTQTGATVLIVD